MDGGWLPEPWSSRLVLDAGASVLLDEATLWPDGSFPTTVLLVRTEFLQQYPDTVRALLRGHLNAIDAAAADPAEAKTVVNAGPAEAHRQRAGRPGDRPCVHQHRARTRTRWPPRSRSWPRTASTAGITDEPTDVRGLRSTSAPLNAELQAAGKPPVDAAGLDQAGQLMTAHDLGESMTTVLDRAPDVGQRTAVELTGVGKVFGGGVYASSLCWRASTCGAAGESVVLLGDSAAARRPC